MFDDRNFTKYLNHYEIEAAVQSIANRINSDFEDQEVVLVGVLKGCVIFMADLVRYLKVDHVVDFVRLTTQRRTKNETGTILINKDLSVDVRDRNVLIVEQIIDSGRTLKFLYERIREAKPKSIEVVTLLDKEDKRLVDIPVKYVGKKTSDQFLVGYGLDLEEVHRNLPDIHYLRYPN